MKSIDHVWLTTSAIGRALANIGYSGDKRASREEMAKTQQPSPAPKKQTAPPLNWRGLVAGATSEKTLNEIFGVAMAAGWWSDEVRDAFTARKAQIKAGIEPEILAHEAEMARA